MLGIKEKSSAMGLAEGYISLELYICFVMLSSGLYAWSKLR